MAQGQEPTLDAVRRARAAMRAAAAQESTLAAVQRARGTPPSEGAGVVLSDTTTGPNGIRSSDAAAVQSYVDSLNAAHEPITPEYLRRTAPQPHPPTDRATHERRRAFGRQPVRAGAPVSVAPSGPAAGRGAPGYNVNAPGRDVMEGIGRSLGQAAVGTVDAGKLLPFTGTNTLEYFTNPEEQRARAAGLVTAPYHAAMHTRDVTQRVREGDDVSPGEIAEAWSTGAFGLLGGYEAVRGLPGMFRKGSVAPGEPEVLEPPEAPPPAPAPKPPRGTRASQMMLDKVIRQQRAELQPKPKRAAPPGPGPSELDALIQQQQADLAAGVAGPPEKPHVSPAVDAMERAKQIEPDRLRDVPIEELGETPAPGQNFDEAALERRVRQVGPRMLAKEKAKEAALRKKGFAPEPPTQTPEARPDVEQLRQQLGEKGFIGTGPESMTPEALKQTKIIGEAPEPTTRAEIEADMTPAERVEWRRRLQMERESPVNPEDYDFAKESAAAESPGGTKLYGEETPVQRPDVLTPRERGMIEAEGYYLKGGRSPYKFGTPADAAFKRGRATRQSGKPLSGEAARAEMDMRDMYGSLGETSKLHPRSKKLPKLRVGDTVEFDDAGNIVDYKPIDQPPEVVGNIEPAQPGPEASTAPEARSRELDALIREVERVSGVKAPQRGEQGPRHGTDVDAAVSIIKEGLRPGSSVSMPGGRDFEGYGVTLEFEGVRGARNYESPLGPTMHEGAANVRGAKRIKRVFLDTGDFATKEDAQSAFVRLREALDENGYRHVPIEAAKYHEELPGTKQEGYTYGGQVSFEGMRSWSEHVKRLSDAFERARPPKEHLRRVIWDEANNLMEQLFDEETPYELKGSIREKLDILWAEMERLGIVEPGGLESETRVGAPAEPPPPPKKPPTVEAGGIPPESGDFNAFLIRSKERFRKAGGAERLTIEQSLWDAVRERQQRSDARAAMELAQLQRVMRDMGINVENVGGGKSIAAEESARRARESVPEAPASERALLRDYMQEDVRTPGTRPGAMPPLPEPIPIDLSGIDAQIEALKRQRAELEGAVENVPAKTPREARLQREHATPEQEARAARAKHKRRDYAYEARSLRATIRAMDKTLQRYPETDVREHALQARNEALQTKRAAMERLEEVEALRKGVPLKKPPLKGTAGVEMPLSTTPPKEPGPGGTPGLGNQRGFLNLFASTKKAPKLTPAEARVDAQIAREKVAPRTPFWDKFWHWPMSRLFETGHVPGVLDRRAGGRALPITQRPYYWIKAALDSPKRIAGALRGQGPGYFDDAGAWRDMGVGSLEDAIKPIKGNAAELEKVERLLVAQHNEAMLAAGRETGISPADAAEIIRTASPRTLSVASKIRAWLNATGDAAVESGAFSRKLWNTLREKYPWYIPAERAFEGEGGIPSSGRRRGRGVSAARPPIRRAAKGGEQPYVSPFETIPDYGARMVRYIDLHRAVRSMLDLLDNNRAKLGDLATKLSSKPVSSNATNVLGELLSDKALRLEGDRVSIYNAKTNHVETWKIEPIVNDFLNGLASKEWDFLTEFLATGKKGVQAGVTTYNPFFWLANFWRDNVGRPTISEATKFPFQGAFGKKNIPRYHTMGGGFGVSQESGGFMEHLRAAQPGRSRLRAQQRGRIRQARQLTGTERPVTKTIRGLDEWFKDAGAAFEEVTRGAEFQAQKSLGLSDLEAYVHSQERLGNFAEHGTAGWVRWLDHVTPFLNPAKQGVRAFGEAARRRPGATALKGLATITIPTLALYALNWDDQDIQDLRQAPGGYNSMFLRDPRYYLRVNGGIGPDEWADINTIFRAPKAFLPSNVFGTSFEHALDVARDQDEHGLRRILDDAGNELWQGSVNPILGVPYALARNKAIGTGVPIVPADQEGRLPEDQIGTHPNYSLQDLSRAMPEKLHFSPAHAQYVLGQFGGTAGREAPNVVDILRHSDRLPERRGLADVPGVSRFFARVPTTSTGPIRDVYSDSRRGIQIMNSLQGLTNAGDAAGIARLIEEHGADLGGAMRDQIFTQQLSELGNLAEYMANSEALSPRERREQRDMLLRQMNELARSFHAIQHER